MKFRELKILGLALLFLSITSLIFPNGVLARSGCCSWHGGVAGCDTSTGRQVCNDGTYSPSCTCAYIPPAPKIETKYQTKTVAVTFKTKNINDSSLPEGETKVTQQGVKGSKEITYLVTYTDGVETSRKKVSETVVRQPINKIVATGTKKEEPAGEVAGASTEALTFWDWAIGLTVLFGIPFLVIKKLRAR